MERTFYFTRLLYCGANQVYMVLLKKIFFVGIYSNLLIALAAMAQCALTYVIFTQKTDYRIVCVEGAATLLLYNVSLWWSRPEKPENSRFPRTRWFFRHERLMWFNNTVACIVLLSTVFQMHLYAVVFLGFIGLLSLLYGFPLWNYGGRRVGLRQVPGTKVFYIASIWVFSSVVLPFVQLQADGVPIQKSVFLTLCLLKFIFLLVCTLPFDIRDMRQDALYHLKTIPIMLGKSRTRKACYILLGAHSLIVLIAPYAPILKIGLVATNMVIYFLFRWMILKSGSRYHHVYLLDACLVLQYLLVLLFSQMV